MRRVLSASFVFLLFPSHGLLAGTAQEAERLPPDESPLPSPLHCPVDDEVVENREFAARYQGRRYFMDRKQCQAAFLEDPEKYARQVEPRAALFAAPRPDRASYSPVFLYLGIYIVLGLLSGAVGSYLAIQKGLNGKTWFLWCFFLNLVGLVMVVSTSGRSVEFRSEGVAKTPQTHEPDVCPQCGHLNHPAAARCSHCQTGLDPRVESDVARVG